MTLDELMRGITLPASVHTIVQDLVEQKKVAHESYVMPSIRELDAFLFSISQSARETATCFLVEEIDFDALNELFIHSVDAEVL